MHFGPFEVIVAFLIFLTISAVAGIWGEYKKRQAALEPLRAAIERGQQLDPALIERLMAREPDAGINPQYLRVAGIITASAAVGGPPRRSTPMLDERDAVLLREFAQSQRPLADAQFVAQVTERLQVFSARRLLAAAVAGALRAVFTGLSFGVVAPLRMRHAGIVVLATLGLALRTLLSSSL